MSVAANGLMYAANVTVTSNILQYPFDTTFLTTTMNPLTGVQGYLIDNYVGPIIDSAYFYLVAGTVTTTLTVTPQLLLADGSWNNAVAPNLASGAQTNQTITLATGQIFSGSFNVLSPTAGQPSINLPAIGIRLAVTITSATLSKAQIVFTKR